MLPLDDLLLRAAFAVDGEPATWRDVIATARVWGVWEPVQRAAALSLVEATGAVAGTDGLVQKRVTAVRRERRLFSVDDTARWLGSWGVDMDDWLAHVRGQLLAEELQTPPRTDKPAELMRAEWIEGVVSGALERAARLVAERRAAWVSLGGCGSPEPVALLAAANRLTEEAAASKHVASLVANRQLDWTRLDMQVAVLADEDAARELAYCVREDGRDLLHVAAAGGLQAHASSTIIKDLPAGLRRYLTSARVGEVIGPVEIEGTHQVVVVRALFQPSIDDPETIRRARAVLARRALRRAASRHVVWLGSPVPVA